MYAILTDIDGVVLNWEKAFHEWMTDLGHARVDGWQELYGMHNIYNIPNALDMVNQFNQSAAIGFLEPLRDASNYMWKIRRLGKVFIGVTAMGGDKYSQVLRRDNLGGNFPGMFADIHFLELNESKKDILTELRDKYEGAVWIEDHVDNFRIGVDLGYDSLLMDHGYNQEGETTGGRRVKNWEEIYNHIKGE